MGELIKSVGSGVLHWQKFAIFHQFFAKKLQKTAKNIRKSQFYAILNQINIVRELFRRNEDTAMPTLKILHTWRLVTLRQSHICLLIIYIFKNALHYGLHDVKITSFIRSYKKVLERALQYEF